MTQTTNNQPPKEDLHAIGQELMGHVRSIKTSLQTGTFVSPDAVAGLETIATKLINTKPVLTEIPEVKDPGHNLMRKVGRTPTKAHRADYGKRKNKAVMRTSNPVAAINRKLHPAPAPSANTSKFRPATGAARPKKKVFYNSKERAINFINNYHGKHGSNVVAELQQLDNETKVLLKETLSKMMAMTMMGWIKDIGNSRIVYKQNQSYYLNEDVWDVTKGGSLIYKTTGKAPDIDYDWVYDIISSINVENPLSENKMDIDAVLENIRCQQKKIMK